MKVHLKKAKASAGGAVWAGVLGCVLAAGNSWAAPATHLPAAQPAPAGTFAEPSLTTDVRETLAWVLSNQDHGGQPFMVVDKRQARVFVFNPAGRLLGAAPALLGMAVGDVDTPGVGLKPVSQIAVTERITPAGRFDSEPGVGLQGDAIVWLEYDAGLAIHRVRPGPAQLAREQRLTQASGRRVSFGCVVLSPEFLDAVVLPQLGRQAGVVYVLPETRRLREWLQSLHQMQAL